MRKKLENDLVKSIPYMEDGQIKSLGLENGTFYVYRYQNKKDIKKDIYKYNLNGYSKTLEEYYDTLNKYLVKNKEIMMPFYYKNSEFKNLKLKICMYKLALATDFIFLISPLIVFMLSGNLLVMVFSAICSLIGVIDACFLSIKGLLKFTKIDKQYREFLNYKELEKQYTYNYKFIKKSTKTNNVLYNIKYRNVSRNKPKIRVKKINNEV